MFSCLERTTLNFTLHHFSPLSFLLDNPTSWPEPADQASLLSIEVNSLNVTILVVFMFEKHITEVTFETLLVFKFDVVLKILCSFEQSCSPQLCRGRGGECGFSDEPTSQRNGWTRSHRFHMRSSQEWCYIVSCEMKKG